MQRKGNLKIPKAKCSYEFENVINLNETFESNSLITEVISENVTFFKKLVETF